ncbi:MAG: hypothetical protein RL186_723, partial [Pseudomonadota bacterium]
MNGWGWCGFEDIILKGVILPIEHSGQAARDGLTQGLDPDFFGAGKIIEHIAQHFVAPGMANAQPHPHKARSRLANDGTQAIVARRAAADFDPTAP